MDVVEVADEVGARACLLDRQLVEAALGSALAGQPLPAQMLAVIPRTVRRR